MYLGIQERRLVRRSHGEAVGYRYSTGHIYRCEHCGAETAPQVQRADEPFYCACNHLISLALEAVARTL